MNPKWKRSGVVFVSQNLKWETHILLSCYGFICKLSDMSGFATFPEVFSSMTKLQRRWKYRLFLELFVCSMNAIVPGVKTKCVDIELIHVALRRVATIVSFYLENRMVNWEKSQWKCWLNTQEVVSLCSSFTMLSKIRPFAALLRLFGNLLHMTLALISWRVYTVR